MNAGPVTLFEAVFTPESRAVASFWTRANAQQFCDDQNDAVQACILEVEDVACVDRYGFPVSRVEYRELHPVQP